MRIKYYQLWQEVITWRCATILGTKDPSTNFAGHSLIPHICHFFSTGTIFGSNFLHTIARKSRQNDFATKQRKSLIMKEISDFSPHLSCGDIWNYSTCGEISDFSTFFMLRNVKLLHMWRNFRFLHICHVKLIHMWWNFRFLHICHV